MTLIAATVVKIRPGPPVSAPTRRVNDRTPTSRLLGVHATTAGGLIAAIARARSCGSHLIQSVCGDKAVAGATCHLHGVFGT